MMHRFNLRLLIATSLLLLPVSLGAQTRIAELPADAGHDAGALHRALLGSGYRDAWIVPIRVPVLDLDTFAGGLTAFREGGNQTRTLRLRAGNGKIYQFRSSRKYLPRALPDDLQDTPAGDLIRDQSSAMHPTGHLIVSGLEVAADVLHPVPQLVVLPDHERLGEFREKFAGMLGQIEERPEDFDDNEELNFAGAEKIVDSDKLLENLDESMEDYLDAREYLRVRLIDFMVGDTDRGGDQWQFARFEAGERDVYRAIPRDRDYAFMHSDGFLIRIVAMAYPKLVLYNERFAKLRSYMFMNREFDRTHLSELTWPDWEAVIKQLQANLSDRAIDDALSRLPEPHQRLTSGKLSASLRARRDQLRDYAWKYYHWVSEEPDVFASDEREFADIERHADGSVTVRLYREGAGGDVAGTNGHNGTHKPAWERRFVPSETNEIRVFLERGNDRVFVHGTAQNSIDVRVMGGEGDDVFVDSSRVSRDDTFTTFYDAHGNNTFVTNRHTRVVRKPFVTKQPVEAEGDDDEKKKSDRVAQEERRGRFQDLMNASSGFVEQKTKAETRRTWGQKFGIVPAVELREGSDVILGVGYGLTDFGFRRAPYESRVVLTGLVSPTTGRLGAQFTWDWHPENARWALSLFARGTQFEANRFFGWGNESPYEDVSGSLVRRDEIIVHPNVNYTFKRGGYFSIGPVARHTNPHVITGSVADTIGRGACPPMSFSCGFLLGRSQLTQFGGRADLVLNTTDMSSMPRNGLSLRSGVQGFLEEKGCDEDAPCAGAYYNAHATIATYLSIGAPVLALRVGGSRVFGDGFAVHDAAFIGGQQTLRGYRWNRFAGEAAAFGGAELRIPITRAVIFTRGDLGILGLVDAGRVWYNDDSPGGWHTGVGGGLWFHTLGQTFSVHYARGEDEGRFYIKLGPAF